MRQSSGVFRCLEILDETLFSDCRRTALLWWDDRIEDLREIDPVRVKHLELEAERMPCADSFSLTANYACEEQRHSVVFITFMIAHL